MTDGKEIAPPVEQSEKPQVESSQNQATQTPSSHQVEKRAFLQGLKDKFDLHRLRKKLAKEMPTPNQEQLKQSNNPAIQTAVEKEREHILTKYPKADIATAHQDARDKVAQQIRMERLREENQQNLAEKQEAEKLSMFDPLTGLHNRRWFEDEEFVRKTAEVQRLGKELYALFIDFDNFKKINNRYGQAGGDEALKLINKLNSRTEEQIARLAGDEFVQLVDEDITPDGLIALKQRYIDTMNEESAKLLKTLPLSESSTIQEPMESFGLCIGFTKYIPGETCEDLLKRADAALKQAKKDPGKNSAYISELVNGVLVTRKLEQPDILTPKIALPV